MFYECSSLNELNISNFDTNNLHCMNDMFFGCSEQIKKKIKSLNKFKDNAFK